MNGMIGLAGLVGIVIFIVVLALRTRKLKKGVGQFYQKHSLITTNDAPQIVREAIGVTDPMCLRGNVTLSAGGEVPICWWEWFIRSTYYSGNAPHGSITCFLAISFPPNVLSEAFEQKTIQATRARKPFSQKLKNAFGLNTRTPIRVEKLADGSFVIFWQILQQAQVLEDKIAWLKNNVRIKDNPQAASPLNRELKSESDAVASSGRDSVKTGEATFYKHDNYAALKHTFNSAWPNLLLELHHLGNRLDKEGRDDFDEDAIFADVNGPNDIVLSLTNQTLAGEAIQILSKTFNGQAFILREYASVEEEETLEYCNDPFTLPLDRFTYGDFKRRFTERWTNLSIELYDTSPDAGGLSQNSRELADTFNMSTLKIVGDPLHDYMFISDWGTSLKRGCIAAAIKNNKLGIYCEGNWRFQRLRKFQAAETAVCKG